MEAFVVPDLPEIQPGDDISDLIQTNTPLIDSDVVCIASTVVSKAEGRTANLSDFHPGQRARAIAKRISDIAGEEKDPRFAQAVLEESTEIIMDAPFLLTATHFGHIGVNAGIDRSNTKDADLLLLPENPSKSAEQIRRGFEQNPAVIITDTCGRPFRHGQQAVAIGWAGMPASRDWRGEVDRDGYELHVTMECVVDELASTANLLMGEGNGGTPAVVIRDWSFGDHGQSDLVFRDPPKDFVRQALLEWNYAGH